MASFIKTRMKLQSDKKKVKRLMEIIVIGFFFCIIVVNR